ncbi:hypothetical protein WA577_005598, partial [Blastocystis sp. JDR]
SNCTPALAAHAAPLIVERLAALYGATQSKQSKTYMVGLLTALVETVPDGAHFSGLLFSCFQLMWGEAVALGDEMTQLLLLRLACSMVKRLPSLLTGDGAQTASQGVQSAQSTQITQERERRE